MANFLGLNITKAAPRLRVEGTAFADRTARNEAIIAKAPNLPAKNWNVDTQVNFVNAIPPFGLNPPKAAMSGEIANLEERAITTDPRELWYLALPNKLTPQQCLQILRAALGGDIWQQWQLASLMMDTWPTFRMACHQLREAAAYAKYTVTPYAEDGEEPNDEAKEKAGLVSRALKGMEPNPFNDERGMTGMIYNFTDALVNGLSLEEVMWEQRTSQKHGKENMPRATAWVHPRHFTFSNEGFISVFDDSYARLYANPQLTNNGRVGQSPDPNKFICSQFISRSGSSLGAGFMRPLVWYWAARQFNNEWMLNTAKQYGSPFIEITFKSGTPASELAQLDTMLKNAGPERRLRHPEGTTATIHPPTSLGADNPQRYIAEEADKQCLFLLLGQSGTTMPTAGALGNQDAHKEVAEEKVVGVAKWIAHNPLRQFARAVLRVNYGEASECPTIEPDFTHPLNATETVAFATGLTNSRLPFRADEAYKKLGMSQPEKGDVVIQGGEVKVMGDALTDQEKFDQQMEQQQAVAEAQGQGQQDGQGNGDEPTQARGGLVFAAGTSTGAKKGWEGRKLGGHIKTTDGRYLEIRRTEKDPTGMFKFRTGNEDELDQHMAEHIPQSSGHNFLVQNLASRGYKIRQSDHKKLEEFFAGPEAATESGFDKHYRQALTRATDAELAELKTLVQAAEAAPHPNGELTALNRKLLELSTR
jgi:phage gp29-like protein